ncbi:hypothetical protein [Streptomyces sp. NPDC004658]|uniref:hypothetical protein n=1 Tax=Streptomyces sp. NPDC004658 TaxID=3154672 RepID=UPI0033AF29AC
MPSRSRSWRNARPPLCYAPGMFALLGAGLLVTASMAETGPFVMIGRLIGTCVISEASKTLADTIGTNELGASSQAAS